MEDNHPAWPHPHIVRLSQSALKRSNPQSAMIVEPVSEALPSSLGVSLKVIFFWDNVKVMATLLAGANVDRGVEVEIKWKHGKQRG